MEPRGDDEVLMSDTKQSTNRRLSREVVLAGAVALADEIGAEALTIRKLADHLGTKPMSIYHHVANKDAILDGMVDRVFAEIEVPPADLEWRAAMAVRMHSGRAALARHSWAAALLETRTTPGHETLAHHDAVLGCFYRAGFSDGLASHAYAVLDSYLYGFALQEASLPFDGGAPPPELVESIIESMPDDELPNLRRQAVDHVLQPGYAFGNAFAVGLEILLDGFEARRLAER